MNQWKPESWRSYPAYHQPVYDNQDELIAAEKDLRKQPPLVFAGEVRQLKKHFEQVVEGKAFILQGGDCAESFRDFSTVTIRDTFKILMQMAIILTFGTGCPIVKIGRIAGQFAKPRSEDYETIDGVTLPSYRGDIINNNEFTPEARRPDPQKMLQAYHQSAATLNIVRAFAKGGLASLEQVHLWNLDFVNDATTSQFEKIALRIDEAIHFMRAVGITVENTANLRETTLYTSHEALLLPYEQALTRCDHITNQWYACSGHLLWIGDRTRQPDGAHVEFLSGVKNPIAIKLGPSITTEDIDRLLAKLNPTNEKGRIIFIIRMGEKLIEKKLAPLIRHVKKEGYHVIWSTDPMHGNTIKTASGYKTRIIDSVFNEMNLFFQIHKSEGSYAGGIHFEMTGADVTECIGGDYLKVTEEMLSSHYRTQCDPRLNANQSVEMAFRIVNILKNM